MPANGNGALQQIDALESPSVPEFQPLPLATSPQPLATVLTTTDQAVNGPNGSVDNGGRIDRLVSDRYAELNAWSTQNLGVPFAVPSVQSGMQRLGISILGAFIGGYHGSKRNPGKNRVVSMLGYGLAGAIFPIGTLLVGAVQGYAKPKRR